MLWFILDFWGRIFHGGAFTFTFMILCLIIPHCFCSLTFIFLKYLTAGSNVFSSFSPTINSVLFILSHTECRLLRLGAKPVFFLLSSSLLECLIIQCKTSQGRHQAGYVQQHTGTLTHSATRGGGGGDFVAGWSLFGHCLSCFYFQLYAALLFDAWCCTDSLKSQVGQNVSKSPKLSAGLWLCHMFCTRL